MLTIVMDTRIRDGEETHTVQCGECGTSFVTNVEDVATTWADNHAAGHGHQERPTHNLTLWDRLERRERRDDD